MKNEIRLSDCEDGNDFKHNAECKDWIRQLLSNITAILGNQLTMNIHAYYYNTTPMFCIDLDKKNRNKDEFGIPITVALSSDTINLNLISDSQYDIQLPGIGDVLYLIEKIIAHIRDGAGDIAFSVNHAHIPTAEIIKK